MELMLRKTPTGLVPEIAFDHSKYESLKMGQPVKVTLVKVSERNYRFHCMYFGGLLELAADYFEPHGGLVSKEERNFLKRFIRFIERMAGGIQPGLRQAYKEFLRQARSARASKVSQVELPRHQMIEELHRWVKEESGLYDVIETPSGCHKKLKSIKFREMSEEQFEAYFRGAYQVVWNYLLSQKFQDQREFDRILHQLMSMA